MSQVAIAFIGAMQVITVAAIGGMVTIFLARIAKGQEKAAEKVEEVAVKLDETKTATDKKLDDIAATTDKVHILTNNAMQKVLESNKNLAEELAQLKPTQQNIDAADKAKDDFDEHAAKQKVVDAKDAKEEAK